MQMRSRIASRQALRTGSRDELVPNRSATVEKIKGELVRLGKGKDGAGVKEGGDQLLDQLGAPPKLFLRFLCHFSQLGCAE